MKISSLIERLRRFDQNAEVGCMDVDGYRWELTGEILDIGGFPADEDEDSPPDIYLEMNLDA